MAQSIQVLMSPKPSPYISDWQLQTETIKLIISNTSQNVIVVKIKTELLDGSSSVIAATDAVKMPELEVSPGVNTYDASEVFPLSAINYTGKAQNTIAKTGRIPDDNYQLCVALTSPQTGQVIGTSGTVCKTFAITAFQAPTLINPINNQEIAEIGIKGIVFRWTPIIPKPRDPVTYRLQVWEVLEGQTPMIALRTNQPIVEKDCKEILQTQWPIDNALPEAGKKYVWTITPLDGEDRKLVDGSGMSEPFSFSILSNQTNLSVIQLIEPLNGIKLSAEEVNNITFRWTPIIPKPRDPVIYRLKVWQLIQGQNSAEAMRTNKPIVTKDVVDVTECKIKEKITFPPNCIWQVEALDEKGSVLGKSEPSTLSISNLKTIPLISPANNEIVQIKTDGSSVNFNWHPCHPPPPCNRNFTLQVWAISDGQTAEDAVKNNKVLVEKTTKELSLSLSSDIFCNPPKLPCAQNGLVWRVRAVDQGGNPEGESQLQTFYLNSAGLKTIPLISPANNEIVQIKTDGSSVNFNWHPCHPPPPCNRNFTLQVWAISDGQTAEDAVKNNKVLVEKTTKELSLSLSSDIFCNPPKLPCPQNGLVWRVRAVDQGGNLEGESQLQTFYLNSAGCGTNSATIEMICDKIVEGVQTYKVTINFNNVASGAVQTCATIMNAITSPTGVLSSITSLPATIPANGNVVVSFIYVPNTSSAATADFLFKGIWQDGNSNSSNFSKLNNKLPICQPKECCPGKWSKNIDESTGKPIGHLANLGTFKCDEKRKFTFCYDCPKDCGESKIKYEILDESKNIVTALTIDATNCATTAVTFPSISGIYELRVSGLCDGKVCNWLRYPFTVECKQKPTECCKNSTIKSVDITNSLGTLVKSLDMVNCKNDTFKISPNFRNCDQYYLFSTNGVCGNNCKIKTIYTVSHATFGSIASIDNTSISAASPSGLYTVKVDFYCGEQLCKTCTFYILKECNIQTPDCCKGGKWISPFLTAPAPTQENKLDYVIINDPSIGSICGKDLQNVKCNSYINFRYAYQCAINTNCKATITYVFKNSKTKEVLNTFSNIENSRNLAFLTPNVSGYYCMTAYAKCGETICDSCTVCFKLDCPPPVDCCKNSAQKDPSIYDAVTGVKVFDLKCAQPSVFRINNALKNCDKDFVVKASASCAQNAACQSKIGFKLTGSSYTNFGIGSINIPATLPNGNYILNVDYYCGNTICKSCKFEIVKDCKKDTIPKNCCENSSWGKVYYQKEKAYVNLSPKGGHLGTFNCKTLLPITANYNCAPGCGPAQIKYIILQNLNPVVPSQTLPSGSTFNLIIPTNTSTNYNLYILAICNGVECAVGEYTFNVDCPSDSACCGGPDWKVKEILLTNGWGSMPQCGSTLGTYKCKVPKSFKFCYDCKQGCGPSKIKYEVKNVSTGLPEFTTVVSNCTSVSIPMTYANGTYQLDVSAICGDKVCAKCSYSFKIECPANCCDSSYWGRQPEIVNTSTGAVVKSINCDIFETYYINKANRNCDIPMLIRGFFRCNPNLNNCSGITQIKLINSIGSSVYSSMTGGLIIPASLPNGVYTLILDGICDNVICKTCKIKIIKDCDSMSDCCKGGKWENKTYGISAPLIKTAPVSIECNKDYSVECIKDGKLTFNANYNCGNRECKKDVFVKIVSEFDVEVTNSSVPYTMDLAGAYGEFTIMYYAKCGDKICDSCQFVVKVKPCPPPNCCKGTSWISKSISWPGIKDKVELFEEGTLDGAKKMLPPGGSGSADPSGSVGLPPTSINVECATGYTLSQYGKYTFNANYDCGTNKECAKSVKVKITGIGYSGYDGTFPVPYTQTFNLAGNYKIEYIAYCGGQECGKCEYSLLIEKNCCANTKWIDAKYQIVNKKADGTWIWEPGVNSIGNSIPTLKADLGIDISGLNYQCSDQKGCTVQYIVRRKNLTTGNLVYPDEIMPLGQNTTSVYSKPFPQMIYIWAECGGQRCGSPIMFKVECLNKDCEPCKGKKSLNINTGIDASGAVLTSNIADPFWITSYIYPTISSVFTLPATSLLLTPTFNQTKVPGNHTFLRDFYVCSPGSFTVSGKVRCDNQLIKLEIIDASSNPIWVFTGIPTAGDNLTVSANFNKTLNLSTGKYSIRAQYRNRNASESEGGYATIGWFELQGTITSSNGGVSNNKESCCETAGNGTGSTGYINEESAILNPNLDLHLRSSTDTCGDEGSVYYSTDLNNLLANQLVGNTLNFEYGKTIHVSLPHTCGGSDCSVQYIIGQEFNGMPSSYSETLLTPPNTNFPYGLLWTKQFHGKVKIKVFCCGKLCFIKEIIMNPIYPNSAIMTNTEMCSTYNAIIPNPVALYANPCYETKKTVKNFCLQAGQSLGGDCNCACADGGCNSFCGMTVTTTQVEVPCPTAAPSGTVGVSKNTRYYIYTDTPATGELTLTEIKNLINKIIPNLKTDFIALTEYNGTIVLLASGMVNEEYVTLNFFLNKENDNLLFGEYAKVMGSKDASVIENKINKAQLKKHDYVGHVTLLR